MRFIALILVVFVVACDGNRVYEEYREINGAWALSDVKEYEFEIRDIDRPYNLGGTLRNRNTYPYYNLYIKYELLNGDEILLSDLHELILFDPKTGKPLGSGIGDTFDNPFNLLENHTFDKEGLYSLRFTQFMRMDTLKELERISARVEFAVSE